MDQRTFSVGELAGLSGVTVRTLHHYDGIGLLSPTARSTAGYRLYREHDVDRLQQILFYRELGFSLARIKAILDDEGTDALGHLEHQRSLLSEHGRRIEAMAAAVQRAIDARNRGEAMSAEEKLGIFGTYGLADLVDPSVGQRFADALNARDFAATAELIADDAVWHVGGDSEYTGEYAGPDQVLALIHRLDDAGLIGKVNDVCVSDVHVVLLGAGWSSPREAEWVAHAAGDKLGDVYLSI